jgi:hypothetical protein
MLLLKHLKQFHNILKYLKREAEHQQQEPVCQMCSRQRASHSSTSGKYRCKKRRKEKREKETEEKRRKENRIREER